VQRHNPSTYGRVGNSLLLARLPGSWNSLSLSDDLRDPVLSAITVSDVCLRLVCFHFRVGLLVHGASHGKLVTQSTRHCGQLSHYALYEFTTYLLTVYDSQTRQLSTQYVFNMRRWRATSNNNKWRRTDVDDSCCRRTGGPRASAAVGRCSAFIK